MKQPKLDVGMWLTAKKNWTATGIRGILIAGNEYAVNRLLTYGFTVILESAEEIEFYWRELNKYFEIQPQGMKVEVSEHISEVLLRPSEGFTVDVENSDLTKGIIKYKKIEPKLPMSMADLGNYIEGFYLDSFNNIVKLEKGTNYGDNHNVWPSKEWAESVQAQCKLVRLRDAWNGEWKPDYSVADGKHVIRMFKNSLTVLQLNHVNQLLCFSTEAIAQKFLETFKDLIEIYFKPYKS